MGYYHEMEQCYAAKDASRVYGHHDPSYIFSAWNQPGSSGLDTNRKRLDENFGAIQTIQMKIIPEATDMVEDLRIAQIDRGFERLSVDGQGFGLRR